MKCVHGIVGAACVTAAGLTVLATTSIPETENAALFHWEVQTCPPGSGFGGGCALPACSIRVLPHAHHPDLEATLLAMADGGEPLGVMIRDNTAPVQGDNRFEAEILPFLASEGLSLDYVFADIEHSSTGLIPEVDIIELVRQVRDDSSTADAWIGAYNVFPGLPADFHAYPFQVERDGECNRHTLYTESSLSGGLDTAMPACYLFEASATYHAPEGYWYDRGEAYSPTGAAAVLWASLERASLAARFLPEGDHLVPYVNNYSPLSPSERDPDVTYPDPALIPAMQVALVRHLRFRGAEGLYMFDTGEGPEDIRQTLKDTWCDLNPYYANEEPCILNLATSKSTGVEWSGVVLGDTALFQVSNMSDVDLVDYTLPVVDVDVDIPALSHYFGAFQLQDPHVCVPQPVVALDPCLDLVPCQQADVNFDDVVDSADIEAVGDARSHETAVCADEGDVHDVDRDGIIDGSDVIQVWLNRGACVGSGPTGACCLPDASCINTTAEGCVSAGGNFFEGDSCSGTSCGACCRTGVGCVVTTLEACQEIMENGAPLAAGVFHAGDTCATACVGACCLGNDCVQTTCEDCFAQGGTYKGEGEPCGVPTCGVAVLTCREVDISGNGRVDFEELLLVLVAWGASGGPEDIDQSGTVDFQDLLSVLAHWNCTWGACCLPDDTCIVVDDAEDCDTAGGVLLEGVTSCFGFPCGGSGPGF